MGAKKERRPVRVGDRYSDKQAPRRVVKVDSIRNGRVSCTVEPAEPGGSPRATAISELNIQTRYRFLGPGGRGYYDDPPPVDVGQEVSEPWP